MISLNRPIWAQYSRKLRDRLDRPRFNGFFSNLEAQEKGMRRILGRAGDSAMEQICLYWLVDETDGIIADAKYQAIGPTGLIGSAEAASEAVLRKNYNQASRLTADLLDRLMQGEQNRNAFPDGCARYLNLAIEAIADAVKDCQGIPYRESFEMTPIGEERFVEIPGGLSLWNELSDEQKRKIIEDVIEQEIRPYIALDAGNIKIIELRAGKEVVISYEGACVACPASMGSTLQAIQKILRARIHPTLSVMPE